MNRYLRSIVAFAALVVALAFTVPILADDDVVYQSMEVVADNGAETVFDIYPGTVGIENETSPVLVVTDGDGNVEMLCIETAKSAVIREEAERQYNAPSGPGLITTTLFAAQNGVGLQPLTGD